MKILRTTCSYLLLLIGLVHIVFGIFDFVNLSPRMLWFVGTGLAVIYLGLINTIYDLDHLKQIYLVTQISNFLFLIYVVLMIIVAPLLPAFISAALVIALLISNYAVQKVDVSHTHQPAS